MGFRRLYLFTGGVLFHFEWCIRQPQCSSIISYNNTITLVSRTTNNHTDIPPPPLLTLLNIYIYIYLHLQVFNALTRYKELHGDLNVPAPFTIPSSQDWAEPFWGFKLGSHVEGIREKNSLVFGHKDREVSISISLFWV